MAWEKYLKDVLGVSEVVWPEQPAPIEARPYSSEAALAKGRLQSVKILFLAEPGVPSLGELEIFQRMLSAMKLDPDEYYVWEVSTLDLATQEKEIADHTVIVSFSKKISEFLAHQRSRLEQITTFHPLEVEKNPKLKRQVWEDLKSAMEKSGLSARLQS